MKPRAGIGRRLLTSPFNAPDSAAPLKKFALHDRVTHDRYGLGRVIGVEQDFAVEVEFGTRRERIVAPYHKLYRL